MKPRDAATTFSAVAALRALCLSLPHLPTPAEAERLKRFEALVVSPRSATESDVEALLAGWRRWWRSGRADEIVAMAEKLPAELVESDRRLASYALATRETSRCAR